MSNIFCTFAANFYHWLYLTKTYLFVSECKGKEKNSNVQIYKEKSSKKMHFFLVFAIFSEKYEEKSSSLAKLDDMDKQKDRLVEFALDRSLNQTQLESFLGLSSGTLSHATKGLSQKVLTKVFKTFPELNPVWLLTGEGQKLRESNVLTNLYSNGDNAIQVATNFGSIGQQSQSDDKKRIAELEAEVKELKSRLYDLMTQK